MAWVINGFLKGGRFLGEVFSIPIVGKAAAVSVTSLFMAAGLHRLGFPYDKHALTATFLLVGAAGAAITAIGAVFYAIIAIKFKNGNRAALDD